MVGATTIEGNRKRLNEKKPKTSQLRMCVSSFFTFTACVCVSYWAYVSYITFNLMHGLGLYVSRCSAFLNSALRSCSCPPFMSSPLALCLPYPNPVEELNFHAHVVGILHSIFFIALHSIINNAPPSFPFPPPATSASTAASASASPSTDDDDSATLNVRISIGPNSTIRGRRKQSVSLAPRGCRGVCPARMGPATVAPVVVVQGRRRSYIYMKRLFVCLICGVSV